MGKQKLSNVLCALLSCVLLLSSLGTVSFAAESKESVSGTVYEFEENSNYDLSASKNKYDVSSTNTYGLFSITANIEKKSSQNGVPSYVVDSGNIEIQYSYTDAILNAPKDEWHLVQDKTNKLNNVALNEKILNGVFLVQTSKDRTNWITVSESENVFTSTASTTATLYTTQDIEVINGCYYRVIVAYKLEKLKKEDSFLWWDTSDYEYKKIAEVYEFYACASTTGQNTYDPNTTFTWDNDKVLVLVDQFDGYFGEKPIKKGDPHYDISIGQFFVSGYTSKQTDSSGDMVFLKNVGDRVTLWFKLTENIDAIGGNNKVKVTPDSNGHDQYFHTRPTNFGRGALIVKYTDYNNNSDGPKIYTNYLEANASVGADTKVSLFEEGDYEIALDYELTKDGKLSDTEHHYRIYFKFSIRNGNCMVYPFDLVTGAELTNTANTKNGFRLDLAKSRYLKVNVKREMLAEGADGLVEDTRFNGPAKDGAEYKDDGIYTITVSNQYTGQQTQKKIYVGTNLVLLAHMTTGKTIPEIKTLVAQGAIINTDGTITIPVQTEPVTDSVESSNPISEVTTSEPVSEQIETTDEPSDDFDNKPSNKTPAIIVGIVIGVIVILLVVIVVSNKKTARKKNINGGNE